MGSCNSLSWRCSSSAGTARLCGKGWSAANPKLNGDVSDCIRSRFTQEDPLLPAVLPAENSESSMSWTYTIPTYFALCTKRRGSLHCHVMTYALVGTFAVSEEQPGICESPWQRCAVFLRWPVVCWRVARWPAFSVTMTRLPMADFSGASPRVWRCRVASHSSPSDDVPCHERPRENRFNPACE